MTEHMQFSLQLRQMCHISVALNTEDTSMLVIKYAILWQWDNWYGVVHIYIIKLSYPPKEISGIQTNQ